MEKYLPYLYYIVVAVIVLLLLKFIFKLGVKTIIKLLINILVGGIILFLINYIPGVNVEINAITALITGTLGVPGVILILIYYFLIG